jgi:hypothetical protein
MGLGERLVQVEVNDVEAHVPRPADAHDRVEVGAVVVEHGADAVHDLRYLLDMRLEEPQRRGIGQHETGHLFSGLGAQIVDVDVAVRIGSDLDHLASRHRDRGWVGPVRGVGRQYL